MPADRFDEDEIAEIFARAAAIETSPRPRTSTSGELTLAELQEIGREAGLSPEAMAPGDIADVVPLIGIGAAVFGAGVLQVPGWARRRRRQFEEIAERLRHAIRG